MTINYNPRVVTDGLVAHYDAANYKSAANITRNLLPEAENLASVNWTKEGGFGTVTPNYGLAPDGTQTSTRLQYSSGYFYRRSDTAPAIPALTAGTVITYSCWVKGAPQAGRGIGIWSYAVGGIVTASTQAINATTWTRVSLTYTIAAGATTFAIMLSGAPGNIFQGDIEVWGPMLEIGSTLTDYYRPAQRSTIWTDITGNGYNATLINSPVYSQDNGGSLMFSGTQYATVANPLITQPTLLQEWSVSAWLKVDDTGGQNLLNLNNGLYPSYGTNNSLLYLNGGVDDYYTYGGDIGNTGWSYVTFRFKNSTGYRTIYKNAINISTSGPNLTSRPSGNPNTLTIAGNLRGNLSKLEIYNRVLSDTEVQQNFNAARGRYGV